MNRGTMLQRITIIAALLLAAAALILVSGCGYETSKANELVAEAGETDAAAETKLQQIDKLIAQATAQLTQGQTEAQIASLTEAQVLIQDVIGDLEASKAKIDEAAALNITDSHRRYLEASSRGLAASIEMMDASYTLTATLLADPTFADPATAQKVTKQQEAVIAISKRVQEAKDEADRIADENPGEIEAE